MRAFFSTFLFLSFFLLSACALFEGKENHKKVHYEKNNHEELNCRSRCENSFTQVFELGSNGNGNGNGEKCVVKFAYPCFPAGCDRDRVSCRLDCSSDKDCALGARCNTLERRCVPDGQYSCRDNFTKVDGVGSQGSCVPYRCNLGQCMSSCVSGSDCAKGFICDKGQCTLQ